MEKPSPSFKDTGSSKVIVITPEQIKKMGLESDVKNAASKADYSDEPDNLILNIRSKLSTLLQPIEKPKPKAVIETKGGITYRKIPISKDGTPMRKITRISMVKDKTVTKTYADKPKSINPETRPSINSHILNMRSMLSKKMATEEPSELSVEPENKLSKSPQNIAETEQVKIVDPPIKSAANNKIQILSIVPLNAEGNFNEPIASSEESYEGFKEKTIDMETIDFVEDDKVHESKNAVPILHFRNASGAVIEVFQETDSKSDEETSVSQNTEDFEKREENGSTFDDVDDNSSDSDVDRSKFKSYLKYSKFKRTKPVSGVKISEETVEAEQSVQSILQSTKSCSSENELSKKANVEPKLSDEEEAKDIVELKPVPIIQRTSSNASSENNKLQDNSTNNQSDFNSGNDGGEPHPSDADGLKPILKRKISAASLSDESTGTPVKRGRGRPPKNSQSQVTKEPNKVHSLPKSPANKVVKKKVILAPDGTPIVKKRGRPPKVWDKDDPIKKSPKLKSKSPKLNTTHVKTYSKKIPIVNIPRNESHKVSPMVSKVPSMIKLEIEFDADKSVVVEEASAEEIDLQKSAEMVNPIKIKESTPIVNPTPQKETTPSTQPTPTGIPRKRGRPKKSATSITETPTRMATPKPKQPKPIKQRNNTPREVVVSRSGRKRKKIDYSAMNEGESNSDDSYAEEDPPSKADLSDHDFEEFPIRSSFNKEYEHKVYPAKRKSFKSESDTNEGENKKDENTIEDEELSGGTTETTKESSITEKQHIQASFAKETDDTPKKIDDILKKTDDTPQNADDTPKKTEDTNKNTDGTTMKTDDIPKKKRGRPRKNAESTSPTNIPDLIPSPNKTPSSSRVLSKNTSDDSITPKSSAVSESVAKLPKKVAVSTSRKETPVRTSSPKKAKKFKAESDTEEPSEYETTEQDKEETKPHMQSRKREMSVDAVFACMFNMVAKETDGPHPINIYSRTDFSSKLPPAEDRGTVVCAICEAEVPIKSFGRHNLTKHNNLAWRIGDTVLNLSNYGLVLGIYTDQYKLRENFVCDRKCGITKKSIMGYLSHYIVCEKSAEEVDDMKKPCEACGRLMMPFYYVNHLKDCKIKLPDETQKAKKQNVKHKFQHRILPLAEDILTLSIPEILGHMLNVIKDNKSGVNAINVYLRMDLEDLEKREPPPEGQAICALCNMEMKSNKFELHNLSSHNNLSWKIGEPKLDLDKYDSIIPTLNTMYTNRQQFICEQCSTRVKSVWGFLWHVATCGKSPQEIEMCKLTCPKCQHLIVPTNYSAHTRNCLIAVKMSELEIDSEVEQEQPGKKQRAAATNPSCNVTYRTIFYSKTYKISRVYDLRATKFIQHLTTIEDEKSADDNVLDFFYIDHKFFKSRKLVDFIEKRKKHRTYNCIFEDCDYNNEDVELLTCHLFTCLKKPKKNFTCKICLAVLKTMNEAYSHMNDQHKEQLEQEVSSASSLSSEEENFDEETLERNRKKRLRREFRDDVELTPWELVRVQDLRLYKIDYNSKSQFTITKEFSSNFPTGYYWNLEFVKQNFSNRLYSICNSWSNWKSVLPYNIVSYLPKLRTSFDAAFVKTNILSKPIQKLNSKYEWISLKLFEAQRTNDSWTIFCGGPVHSIAWAPVYCVDDEKDDEKESRLYDQYLAVSVLSDPDNVVKQGQVKAECSLVQIWNFGPIQVEKSMFQTEDFKPHLEYCLAHKHGDYCCLEWCPSGGFEEDRRLGLLAIGGTDSFVHIYEMPLINALNKQGSIIFEAQPKYKLECMKLNEMDYSEKQTIPTSISWTKAKDHRYIAVGYCSGLLALFDLLTESPHLKSVSGDNVILLKPYLVFVAHAAAVTASSLHHMHGGNRWIATFSLDRTHKLWDLENYSQPIYIFHKFQMVDGIWPTHWLTTIMAYDDVAIEGRGGSTGIFFPIKRFTGTYFHFYNYFTRTNSLAVSDWSNMLAYSNVIGHIMGSFVNTCIPTTSHGMPALRNYNISFTDLIDKTISVEEAKQGHSTSNENECNNILGEVMYAPAKKRYGVIFYDSPINCNKTLEEMRRRGPANSSMILKTDGSNNPGMYPLRSATKVVINPNQQAHSYIAVGYQLGFVRIFCPYLYKENKK